MTLCLPVKFRPNRFRFAGVICEKKVISHSIMPLIYDIMYVVYQSTANSSYFVTHACDVSAVVCVGLGHDNPGELKTQFPGFVFPQVVQRH